MNEVKVTEQNFDTEVLQSSLPVLVDFWATWCGPCRMLSPILAELAQEYDGKLTVGKVNVDEEMSLAQHYNIMSIPTVLLFRNGEIVSSSVGYCTKDEMREFIDSALA